MMWSVQEILAVPVQLDFTSSGQGHRSATAIDVSGIRLFNALELVEVQPAATQVEICDSCGIPHCAPGGWVDFRRIDDRVIWMPAFDQMEKGVHEESEYRPPSFLQSKGAPVFSPEVWKKLRALHGGLPACDELPDINSREAARLCQWSAPGRVLGSYPMEPRLRRDLILAVTEGDLVAQADGVDACLQRHFGVLTKMAFVASDVTVAPIEFWLDLPDIEGWARSNIEGWARFAHVENSVCMLVDGMTALMSATVDRCD